MERGLITNNEATDGGAVYIDRAKFFMTGGNITGNSASNNGGGVYVYGDADSLDSSVFK